MFWRQTPRLFFLAVRGKARAAQTEHRNRAWLAWHIEALQRTKRLPRLSDLAPGPSRPVKPKSSSQLLAIARLWDSRLNRA